MLGPHRLAWRQRARGDAHADHGDHPMARRRLPAGCVLQRCRDQLRPLRRARHQGGAVPRRRARRRAPAAPRGEAVRRLAHLPADGWPRAAVRVPGARAVGPGTRPAVQRAQAPAGPLCQGDHRHARRQPGRPRASGRRPQRPRHDRQLRPHHARGGHKPVLRLDLGPPHAPPVQRDDHLRGARQGDDDAPPGHPASTARHLRGAGPSRDGRVPGRPRHQRHRAHADPPVRPGRVPAGSRASATTGATTRSGSSPRTTSTRRPGRAASRSTSSRGWSSSCTWPASR